jgi:glutathione S-transferase
MVRLIGRNLSPFVRRCAVTMRLYEMTYQHEALSTVTDGDKIAAINPLGRVPALVLDDGEALVDSAAILDHLDLLVGPGRALVPGAGRARRDVLRLAAIMCGALDKAVIASYEKNRRPKEFIYQPYIEKLDGQVAGGLAALESIGPDPWLVGSTMTQADVTTAVGVTFLKLMHPHLMPAGRYPRLEALAARCEALPAFQACKPET